MCVIVVSGSIQLRPLDNDASTPLPQVTECCESAELEPEAPNTVAKTTSWDISRDITDKLTLPWCSEEQDLDAVAIETEPDTADAFDHQETWSPGRHGGDEVSIYEEKDSAGSVDLKELAAAWYPAEDEEDVLNMNSCEKQQLVTW